MLSFYKQLKVVLGRKISNRSPPLVLNREDPRRDEDFTKFFRGLGQFRAIICEFKSFWLVFLKILRVFVPFFPFFARFTVIELGT